MYNLLYETKVTGEDKALKAHVKKLEVFNIFDLKQKETKGKQREKRRITC